MSDPVLQAEIVKVDEEQAWWDENPERREFLNLRISGATITYAQKVLSAARVEQARQVAIKAGAEIKKSGKVVGFDPEKVPQISRVTLHAWEDHEYFRKRLAVEQRDYENALIQRRARETSLINDHISKMARKQAERLADMPTKDIKFDDLGKLERLTGMFSRMRNEERIDLGIDGKTVTHRVGIVGQLNVNNGKPAQEIGSLPFAKLLGSHAPSLDLGMMDTDDPEEALGEIGAQMIAHSGFLDEEDAKEPPK